MLQDVGFQPRLGGWSAAALVNEAPVLQAYRLSHKSAHFPELVLIRAACRHRLGNAVGGEGNASRGLAFWRDLFPSPPHVLHGGLDEPGMVVEHPQLVHFRCASAHFSLSLLNIFAILPAA